MRDPRTPILQQLVTVLKPIGLPVKSVVPDNHKTPYIYIGDIQTFQQPNKESFEIMGLIAVELWSGTNEWRGSYKQALQWLDEIKVRMQPTTRSRLDLSPYFKMSRLRLDNDSGIKSYGQANKNWTVQIQYEFECMQVLDAIEYSNVIHNGDNVIFNGFNIVHTKFIKYIP